MAVSARREELVDRALDLFYRHGFHATGIDRILAESGVAKMTLYKHFKSKDELILAALKRRDEKFRTWFMCEIERRGRSPRERLLVVFDILAVWFASREFRGCMFVNAASEFHEAGDPIHRAAAEHKRLIRDFLKRLATEAGAREPDAVAGALNLLLEGAIAVAHVAGDASAASDARAAAEILINRALG
ncbi:MAG: TetR family transcriptional regulator [Proteobacteria bacterium]|nr:TetR family transcriptional regulator [Pseudomonadota bacterium]